MTLQYQPYEVKEFHGGITDNFIDAQPNQYEEADNFLITENRKLYTRPGSAIWDDTNYQIPAGAQRVGALIDHYDTLLTVSAKKVYYIDSTWQTLQGPTGNDVLTTADTNSVIFWADWNKHTFIGNDDYAPVNKIYIDSGGTMRARTAGLPKLASTPSLAGGGSGANNYIYAFMYYYEYTVGTVTHIDRGHVTTAQILGITTPDGTTVNITGIPVISNSTTYNWDTTAIKCKIYRTQANGTTFTYVGEVTNGTTTYNDTSSDATIASNEALYTDSGTLDNDPVPLCKCMHITDTVAYYGNIKTSAGEEITNRVRQSKPDDPDSCPESLYADLDDEIVAISSVGQTAIVLCRDSIYRLDGQFDAAGGGLMLPQEIESTVGCISANSVVQIQRGVVWAARSGFYFTDGYEVRKLSGAFNTRFSSLVKTTQQQERIYGTFDEVNKRVWWSVQEDGQTEVNKSYILDTRYGLGNQGDDLENLRSSFTTASGTYYRPTAMLFFEETGIGTTQLRADNNGYLYSHNDNLTSDPLVDTGLTPSNWDVTAIIFNFKGIATSFGTNIKRKFVSRNIIVCNNDTNISLQMNLINDLGRITASVKAIRFRKIWAWGDPTIEWGDTEQIWDYKGMLEEQRRSAANALRCSYRQIQFTNAFTQIMNSDDLDTATVNSTAKTVTLDDTGTYDWASDSRGHYIYFEDDNYEQGFLITGRTADVLTVSDATNLLSDGSKKWIIKGYPKDEVLNLLSYAMVYAYLGEAQDYAATTAGSNPA